MRYRADITAGALKVPESRVIADLLLRDVSDKEWRSALYEENVLQTRSPKTAKRLSVLIRGRLSSVEAPLWKLIQDGSVVEATHACLAAAVKASNLLGDFLDLVVDEQRRAKIVARQQVMGGFPVAVRALQRRGLAIGVEPGLGVS